MKLFGRIIQLVTVFLYIFIVIALCTHNASDNSWTFFSTDNFFYNRLGFLGAYWASLLLYLFGYTAYFFIPIGFVICCRVSHVVSASSIKIADLFFMVTTLCTLNALWGVEYMPHVTPGGYIGITCAHILLKICDFYVAGFLCITLLLIGIIIIFPWSICAHYFFAEQQEDIALEKNTCIDQKISIPEKKHREDQEAVYSLPYTLFKPHNKSSNYVQQSNHHDLTKILEQKLESFGINGSVVGCFVGPVVTLFEYEPTIDTKISKIIALEDDLALALHAHSLRIIAPIPGRAVIGFELANEVRYAVTGDALIASTHFIQHVGNLPLIIGEDTLGAHVMIDLATLPHLLVAGSTGSGKSVALNMMIASLLSRCSPDYLKLILIDPKKLEFAAYVDIAHLVFPVITHVERARTVLRWAVQSMDERYEKLAQHGLRNVYEYHKQYGFEGMPFMVIIIDELADLMMQARDIEDSIVRLAQMSRACGIHLIIATQRPSVDVITGLIKVNFPARIACKVTSKTDSRTILDSNGAEKLLGKGDMLFLTTQGTIQRVHGAYIEDSAISSIVQHIKQQRIVEYIPFESAAQLSAIDDVDANLYKEVITFIEQLQSDEISISLLQRKFKIGYNRSARIMALLEERGVIMHDYGSKMRKILR
ncbi:MAG: DNA translocase FtsK 4TM domain-containing protein [Candidatus Babeliaceae bacterium]|jgi:S-DNA-T family DNA segregation ATPase FtsK/SpoIIIE